jgi:hypothetical protein
VGIEVYDTSNDQTVIAQELKRIDVNTLRIFVNGNTDNLRVIVWDGILGTQGNATFENRIIVNQGNFSSTLGGVIDSNKEYFIDGKINTGGTPIVIPANGLSLAGYSFDISGLYSSENSYTMFVSDVGGSGNLVAKDLDLSVTGTSSSVYDLTDVDGTNAIELSRINYTGCTSLGELTNYRQGLETGSGRFGGTPELTFSGNWIGGYRIDTSIVRGISNITSLFKEGTSLVFNGRFILSINCDLPATGNLIDFQASNIASEDSLQLKDCFVTRQGVLDTSDPNISPNIDEKNTKSFWSQNTGVTSTQKYIRDTITTEVTTVVSSSGVFYPLEGVFTTDADVSHFDSPVNGQIRLLSGNGKYQVFGNLILDAGSNNILNLRVTKSEDDGVTFPIEVNHVVRQVNAFLGGRDVAFFDLNFLTALRKNDRLRLEAANDTSTVDIVAELDSTFIATEI